MKNKIFTVLIFLILGYIVNYTSTITESIISGHVMGGSSGFPFPYGTSSFLGNQSFNIYVYIADIIFWAFILFASWKLIQNSNKKKK